MTIGILYESNEWSVFALRDHIEEMGVPATLINMQKEAERDKLLSCRLIINRVFASSVFRGHQKALDQMPTVMGFLKENGIPMINPEEAHYYETSKMRSKEKLAAQDIPVPELYGVFLPEMVADIQGIEYPCVVKPDCGGRTNYTFIVRSHKELCESMADVPEILFIAEEYIWPEYGYITRIEGIGGECKLAVKRSVTETGLSAYRLGSEYEVYEDLPDKVRDMAIRALYCLGIEAGSLDMIENENGVYIIDVNSVSNVSEDNTEMFNFDLMKETAAYAVKRYGNLFSEEKR